MKQYINALPNGAVLKGKSCEYHIDRVLGQGTFGITYLASVKVKMAGSLGTIDANVKVAIKEFFMDKVNGRTKEGTVEGLTEGSLPYKYKQRFRKEAESLAKLNHPNIVKVIDFIEANETFYYVMEYIDGEDLYRYMDGQPLSAVEAVSIIKEVGKALTYMHEEKNMLHLDLKPGNIMRRRSDGHIFLIDFGLTKVFNDNGEPETSTTIGGGTSGYAPLEQNSTSEKKGSFKPTIDVYALGATLLKLLTAEAVPPASKVLNDDELLEGILSRHSVDRDIKDAILKAMYPKPKQRTSSVRQFVHEIENSPDENTQDVEATVYDSKSPVNATAETDVVENSNKQSQFQPNEKDEKYQEEEYDKSSVDYYHDGRAKVKGLSGKYGYIDETGKMVIPCRFDSANNFSEGLAEVFKKGEGWGYIDTNGNLVIPCVWKGTNSFENGYAKVRKDNGEWIFIDKKGKSRNRTYIDVKSDIEGASVSIDGEWIGFTPDKFEVEPGKHEIKVTEGVNWREPYTQSIEVTEGQTRHVFATLEQKTYIDVESTPAKASVAIDDKWIGFTPIKFEVTPGKHEVKVANGADWSVYSQTVEVNKGQTVNVFATLEKKKSYLEVSSEPKGAAVYIDNNWRGVTPKKFHVAPGEHLIRVSHNDRNTYEVTKHVRQGETERINVALTKKKIEKPYVTKYAYYDGLARVEDKNGKYGYVDMSDRIVIPCTWLLSFDFQNGIAEVLDNNYRHGFIDKTGKVVIPCRWEGAYHNTHFGTIQVQDNNGLYGFIDERGFPITPCKYRVAPLYFYYNDWEKAVDLEGRTRYINKEGKEISPLVYHIITGVKNFEEKYHNAIYSGSLIFLIVCVLISPVADVLHLGIQIDKPYHFMATLLTSGLFLLLSIYFDGRKNIIASLCVFSGALLLLCGQVLFTKKKVPDKQFVKVNKMLQLCPDENHPHAIDLGLPSGTKWACCNVGASSPEDFGDYFVRGSIVKCENNISEPDYTTGDISGTNKDAAHDKWGNPWRMPTKWQCQELEKCSFKDTIYSNIKGKIIIGKNGCKIFLPASGNKEIRDRSNPYISWKNDFVGERVLYWTSEKSSQIGYCALALATSYYGQNDSERADYVSDDFEDGFFKIAEYNNFALPIRPVCK